jgi:hypothetical protein
MQETLRPPQHQELTPREQLEYAKAAYDAAKQAYDEWRCQHHGKPFLVPKRTN